MGGPFSVIARHMHDICGAHQRLLQEAELFNGISRLLEQDFFGLETKFAVRPGNPDSPTGSSLAVRSPYFCGFYLPMRKDGSPRVRAQDWGCDEECEGEVL
ncbi:hypothetical protein V8D89_000226 [Ganoderma adspersum]